MKKLIVASVLALAVTMASQTKASAWSEFHFSAGFNLSWCSSGRDWGFSFHSVPCPGGPCMQAPLMPCYAPYYGVPAAPAVPPPPPVAQAAAPEQYQSYNPYYNSGYQPVGYTYPGYSQTPSYWYGR